MANLLEDQFTEEHLFIATGPEERVTLSGGRTVQLNELVLDVAGALEDAFTEVEKRRQRVRSDQGLTKEGKQNRLRELDRLLAQKIRDIASEAPVEDLEERADELERQISDLHPRLDPNDTERAYEYAEKAKEVRQVIRGMDENERTDLLMRAAREDDRPVLLAFEDSPLPLVGDDELAVAREAHLEVRYPERKARVDAIRAGVRLVKANSNIAMGHLAQDSGNPEFELRPFPGSDRAEAAQEAEAALAEAE